MCFQQKSTARWIAKQYALFRDVFQLAAVTAFRWNVRNTRTAQCANLKVRHYSPLLTIRGGDALSLNNYGPHFFQRVDVAERIAFDSDEIAFLARFNRS